MDAEKQQFINDEEEDKLWAEYKKTRSSDLRDRLIRQYMPLVKYVAGKVSVGLPASMEFDDLVGFGQFGLLDAHESQVFTDIAEARSKAGGVVNVDSSIVDDPQKLAEYQKVQNQLGASLQRLLAVTENYPALKANENFLALQNELEGTENRIAVERKRFNDAVQTYNSFIRKFPANIVANMNGFEKKSYFTAEAGANQAPKVEF